MQMIIKENTITEFIQHSTGFTISKSDLINGKVDCIKDINEIYIALAVCTKECKHIQLIVDGSTQVCPKCGEDMFRLKTKKYKIINE